MNKKYTKIQEQDRKLDIIDHVNQDHSKELCMIAQSYGKNLQIKEAYIVDIFEEGILLKVRESSIQKYNELFVRFELKGDLEEQILYLAYNSFVKQKIEFSNNTKQYFEVVEKFQVSKNITRLTIKSQLPLPEYYAGYAYGLVLKALEKSQPIKIRPSQKSSLIKNIFDRSFLWVMKHLSSQKRQKLLETMNKDIRLYTLRQSFTREKSSLNYGYIDIFTHGNSAGSTWVSKLEQGSMISSRTETDDKHTHLHSGTTVLIADETAYPALAGILEFWKNKLPPIVILLCADEADLKYFDGFVFPDNTILKRLQYKAIDQAQQVIQVLEQVEVIENVWGALENNAAKCVRHHLRNQRKLLGKNNHIKGYWRFT
ncbi:siderophore-interacting protein [Acinetobacter nectaris]|uniref:siderophore-interacting protein n=1 Tax=Acinetobacter nectaris TaxID=1219382 RepID=UPI001F2154E6|nr:siderophore-interacting protein [Acinetobacter nectaris]MCF8998229.1 SIP domain-containing protein [Acinetobacter nectaris]MCF9026845.1 SIP domain-containing protein [Acinetobacter nectaris]